MERAVYKPLPFKQLKPETGFYQPSTYQLVQIDSPAIAVMTDLQQVSAATVEPDVQLTQATQKMIARGVRLLLVVDPDDGILGVVTARDTMGERPIKFVQQHGGTHADLKVRDCMTPTDAIEVLTLSEVLRAEVGHIVATLKNVGRQHAMVVDTDAASGKQTVRGIFSITQIGRQLGISLHAFEVATTFAEIEAVLAAT